MRLEHSFNEDGSEDSTTDHPTAVKLFLDFVYLGDYQVPGTTKERVVDSTMKRSKTVRKRRNVGQNAVDVQLDRTHVLEAIRKREKVEQDAVDDQLDQTPVSEANPVKMGPRGTHARMFTFGSKYMVPCLTRTAVSKYNEAVKLGGDSEDDIATAIKIACATATTKLPEMMNAVIASAVGNPELLIRRERIRQVIENNKKLATEIINALARHCHCHCHRAGPPVIGLR